MPLINRAEIFHLLATRTILPRLALSPLLHVPRAKLEALTEVWWDYEKEWPRSAWTWLIRPARGPHEILKLHELLGCRPVYGRGRNPPRFLLLHLNKIRSSAVAAAKREGKADCVPALPP